MKPATLLAEWDPYSMPILTEVAGTVKFGDIDRRRHDERAGGRGHRPRPQGDHRVQGSRRAARASRSRTRRARPASSPTPTADARYMLPVGANIVVTDGDEVDAGDVIAKIPRETTKTKDITGGLPRVAELFEARKPKEHAVISEIDGVVAFGKDTKGKRKVVVTPEVDGKLRPDLAKEYLIGKGKHICGAHRRPRARRARR